MQINNLNLNSTRTWWLAIRSVATIIQSWWRPWNRFPFSFIYMVPITKHLFWPLSHWKSTFYEEILCMYGSFCLCQVISRWTRSYRRRQGCDLAKAKVSWSQSVGIASRWNQYFALIFDHHYNLSSDIFVRTIYKKHLIYQQQGKQHQPADQGHQDWSRLNTVLWFVFIAFPLLQKLQTMWCFTYVFNTYQSETGFNCF